MLEMLHRNHRSKLRIHAPFYRRDVARSTARAASRRRSEALYQRGGRRCTRRALYLAADEYLSAGRGCTAADTATCAAVLRCEMAYGASRARGA